MICKLKLQKLLRKKFLIKFSKYIMESTLFYCSEAVTHRHTHKGNKIFT